MIKELSTNEILERIPSFTEKIKYNSIKGVNLRMKMIKNIIHNIFVHVISQVSEWKLQRVNDYVKDLYENSYGNTVTGDFMKLYRKNDRLNYYQINKSLIIRMEPRYFLRFMTHRIADYIRHCNPSSVCEVGSGTGRNLFFLASEFHNMTFHGFDISRNAVNLSNEIKLINNLHDTDYGKTMQLSGTEPSIQNVRNIIFESGSAFNLPCNDKMFDLVFTNAALEQMNDNYEKALHEIHRISKKYVVFNEPFKDANNIFSNLFLKSRNYFNINTKKLLQYGFRPLFITKAMPIKPTFSFCFVLAEVINKS